MTSKKWLDPDYISTLEHVAKMFAESKATPVAFQGDNASLFSLLMKADAWNISPDMVIAHSYIDNYGRLAHTGNLFRLILTNNAQVDTLNIAESGDWESVRGQFVIHGESEHNRTYTKKWNDDLEQGLSVTVTIEFLTGRKALVRTLAISDIDPSIRALDHTWITSPRKRLESTILRELCYNELYDLVNAYDMESLESEKKSFTAALEKVDKVANKNDEVSTENSVTVTEAAFSASDEKCLIDEALNIQSACIEAQLQCNSEALQGHQEKLVELVKRIPKGATQSAISQLEKIYTETSTIVIDGDEALLES
ncbi:hypothetical protein L1D14_03890 [Vibrio tubiashii]|uniref:hypothetical protein n=1 Tax=Vibrio tubiashii TaxID=29498 RepID=UPI001EFD52D5|nr:hypothetical protein [Vibrio tubiashii]MCG9575372.1 hypothetical protein [Vibrio tubiashii]